MPTQITNWDGSVYSLDVLLEICDASDVHEESFDTIVDSDIATSTTIIRGLIARIRELEAVQVQACPG